MIGRDIAQRVIRQHGTNDLKTIVEKEGLQVRTRHPWPARFEDCYVRPIIFVPRGLSSPDFRTRVAHCLGHHFMHTGNQVWMRGFDATWSAKQERQADEFAAWLTIPADVGSDVALLPPGVARRYRVTQDLAVIRLLNP